MYSFSLSVIFSHSYCFLCTIEVLKSNTIFININIYFCCLCCFNQKNYCADQCHEICHHLYFSWLCNSSSVDWKHKNVLLACMQLLQSMCLPLLCSTAVCEYHSFVITLNFETMYYDAYYFVSYKQCLFDQYLLRIFYNSIQILGHFIIPIKCH